MHKTQTIADATRPASVVAVALMGDPGGDAR
ncbi:hypothetical protein SRABI128_00277 [Microbacterium sp. Bi128]|nr:hypothetical protein SRABI128_00277 [Microbacterium sp. Bi128]